MLIFTRVHDKMLCYQRFYFFNLCRHRQQPLFCNTLLKGCFINSLCLEQFSIGHHNSKPKHHSSQSERAQTIQWTNQLEVITSSWQKAWENMCESSGFGFGFASEWIKMWRKLFFFKANNSFIAQLVKNQLPTLRTALMQRN